MIMLAIHPVPGHDDQIRRGFLNPQMQLVPGRHPSPMNMQVRKMKNRQSLHHFGQVWNRQPILRKLQSSDLSDLKPRPARRGVRFRKGRCGLQHIPSVERFLEDVNAP